MEASKRDYLLASHGIHLFKKLCPKTPEERKRMNKISYASTVESIMYAMLCTRLDIAYALGIDWGPTLRCINQGPNLVGIHRVYFRFHGIELLVRVTTHDSFRIGRRLIILNDVGCIVILNDKLIPEWYTMYSIQPSKRRCV